MRDVVLIFIAMFSVYGFFSAAHELRGILHRLARRFSKKIDNSSDMEYNNNNND